MCRTYRAGVPSGAGPRDQQLAVNTQVFFAGGASERVNSEALKAMVVWRPDSEEARPMWAGAQISGAQARRRGNKRTRDGAERTPRQAPQNRSRQSSARGKGRRATPRAVAARGASSPDDPGSDSDTSVDPNFKLRGQSRSASQRRGAPLRPQRQRVSGAAPGEDRVREERASEEEAPAAGDNRLFKARGAGAARGAQAVEQRRGSALVKRPVGLWLLGESLARHCQDLRFLEEGEVPSRLEETVKDPYARKLLAESWVK